MLFDRQNLFSNAQAVTATAVSTDVIDFGPRQTPMHAANPITRDVGKGRLIDLYAQVVANFATLTSLTVEVQVDDNEAFSSPRVIAVTPAIPVAQLIAGYRFPLRHVPLGADERYMRLRYVVGGSNATAGAITAGFVFDADERDI